MNDCINLTPGHITAHEDYFTLFEEPCPYTDIVYAYIDVSRMDGPLHYTQCVTIYLRPNEPVLSIFDHHMPRSLPILPRFPIIQMPLDVGEGIVNGIERTAKPRTLWHSQALQTLALIRAAREG